MARGVNKVILVGNVGGDPETRYMPNGNAVTNITLATSESWKDKQTGQQQERTEWHRVVFFGRLAEIAGEYLRKGSRSTSKAACAPASGRARTVRIATPPRSWSTSTATCSCSAAAPPATIRSAPARAHAAPAAGPAAAVASGPAAATGAATGPGLRQLRRRHSVLSDALAARPVRATGRPSKTPCRPRAAGVFVFRRRRAARALRPGRLRRTERPAWH